ncbi:hypothetical protein [Streptomyces sp. TLI_185]|uniref:hypothetical protein n=1 Tax=Streptomyces sp. TLI_185 TaxID=2485151 RepID=UPI000FB9EAA8|nr:hypothetical protein [Streptomyces sp. TLI_185]RPF39072.1 hypothetical protein EDD92_9263 [Streptomyces sp. TLI_185]
MHEVKPSDGTITLSPLRLDDAEAHLAGEDERLVRWLSRGPRTREGVSKRPVEVPQRVTPRNHDDMVRGVTMCGHAGSS